MRHIDWLLILLTLILFWIWGSFTFSAEITHQIVVFLVIFFLLSFFIPVNRSRWEKRMYVGINSLIFTIAAALCLKFSLIMCWAIAKSCFLLSRREAIMATILSGIGYLVAYYWGLPRLIAEIETQGVQRWIAPHQLIIGQITFYVGASVLTVIFSLLITAEQKSRRQAEALTQQINTLATTLERTRIARDIHDSLGHALTTLDIQIELAQRLHGQDAVRTEQSLHTAKQLAHQCLTEVRRSVQTMRGDDFNLNEETAALIHSIQQNPTLRVHLDLHLPPLPPQIGHQLYCIIQEGLTNVQKHAQATTVLLKGQQVPDCITIVLQDDGHGFNPQAEQAGFGLRGMQERAQILGGTFTVRSDLGEGTSLLVVIPYPT